MKDLFLSVDKILKSVQSSYSENYVFEDVFSRFLSLFDVDVIFVDRRGNIFRKSKREEINSLRFDCKELIVDDFENNLNEINEANYPEYFIRGYFAFVMPVIFANRRLGTLFFYGKEKPSDECIVCMETICLFLSGIVFGFEKDFERKKSASKEIVRSAFGTLSYSEFEAILAIFGELKENEGILVMKKIADRLNITRSVIVNAIKKFESAGIIESRSLGMKGTYIKVLNKYVFDEVEKIKN